ncbi:MAG TPA: hypothetical protein VKM35_00800 [Arenimonas sp.]|uniref:hypothetical protein n=1 Tax=Arenimonas sp. TaxID=1872635 RepID=UPI002BC0826D|nr:hypothetical protein [Arenimonas sp.]HMB55728.1 hypothetical protein [Arenimonas sp.]
MSGHDPNDNDLNQPRADAARALFDRASARLDTATANRLRLARREALSAPRHRPMFLPVGAAAAAVLAIGLVWWLPKPAVDVAPTTAETSTDPALLGEDDTELYAWLGDAPVAPDKGKSETNSKDGAL